MQIACYADNLHEMSSLFPQKNKTRNLPNGYVVTTGGAQEMELNTQTKHYSTKCEK